MRKLTLLLLTALLISSCTKTTLKLPALVANNMVLQQNSDASIWGWSDNGVDVTVETSWGQVVTTTTNETGKWLATIPTPEFGGPYTITITAGNAKTSINNVMIGEVWLCSGQSNMEMPLTGFPENADIANSEEEIANANYPEMRMFTVTKRVAVEPQNDCIGSWKICSAENAGDFSATAYFFGREIHKTLGIPVGLIHSSWGGTPAEAWTSTKYIEDVPGYEDFDEKMKKAMEDYNQLKVFLSKLNTIGLADLPEEKPYASLDINDEKYASSDFDIAQLENMPIPGIWENSVLNGYDGVVWIFKDIVLDNAIENAQLFLNSIDDMDATYVNGTKIGGYEEEGYYNTERLYNIPSGLLKKGKNRIAVKMIDTGSGGGMSASKSPAIMVNNSPIIDLAGNWKYLPVAIAFDGKYAIFGKGNESYAAAPHPAVNFDQNAPNVLYNGMINPLIPYTIKGAIWYQGEANVGRGKQYETLFPTMITNWRNDWDLGAFPFYFVQIAPWAYGDDDATAEVRDAQLKTLSLENTGMAVTMDIGNPENIHPANKQDVGKRLALWALNKDYGKTDLVYSGPIFKSADFNGHSVKVNFNYADNGLQLSSNESFIEIAGKDGVFYPAKIKIEGSTLNVSCSKVAHPVQVRYAWCDNCEPNLFNTEGLPASPFLAKNK